MWSIYYYIIILLLLLISDSNDSLVLKILLFQWKQKPPNVLCLKYCKL